MTMLNIPDDVAKRLESLAEQEGISVVNLIRNWINTHSSKPPIGSLAELAKNAQEAGLASPHPVDTAENSREILNSEFADYL